MRLQEIILRYFFERWGFLHVPDIPDDIAREQAFEMLWRDIETGRGLDYELPYPKWWFTHWLTGNKNVLLHGSNHGGIESLIPRQQTNFSGRQVEGVFASSDGLWPLFFAAINSQNPEFRSTRNGCFNLGGEKYYCFNISEGAFSGEVWAEGWIYILPGGGFRSQQPGGMWRDEWVCPEPISPLAALPVTSADFPFRDAVVGFPRGEGVLKTWRLYGRRRTS